ncbi:MAG: ABC transporter permease [Acidimicrobiia bacterium]
MIPLRYVLRRIGQALLVMWAAYTVVFVVLYLVPGDPARLMLGLDGGASASEEQIQAIRDEYGFDDPLVVQYWSNLSELLGGDMGDSFASGVSVGRIIGDALPNTVSLTALGLAFAVLIGVGVVLAAQHAPFPWLARLLASVPAVGVSIPGFWVGLLLLQFLSFRIRIFPAAGDAGFKSLVLPALVLALPAAAVIAQIFGQSMRATLAEPYVDTARAKGARRSRIVYRHAFRNALLPVVAVLGTTVGTMFANSAVAETIFARNGLGTVMVAAVTSKDMPVVQGVVLVVAAFYALTTLAIDLVSPVIDPRAGIEARTA